MKIFHHLDADGKCAGAIAWRSPLVNRSQAYEVIEIDYKILEAGEYDLDNNIHPNEVLIIVDFSFKPPDMKKILKKTPYIIWLDHHLTSLKYKYDMELEGIRSEKYSGCELAWKYFFPDKKMPRAVEYIGDRDKWANLLEDSTRFVEGLKLHPHGPKDPIWDLLLGSDAGFDIEGREEMEVDKIVSDGRMCIKYRENFCRDYAKSFGFKTIFEGKKAYALGLLTLGMDAFGEKAKEYELLLGFEFDGKQYTVGVFSETAGVSEICEKYGGGGHAGAGGFICKELPFKKS